MSTQICVEIFNKCVDLVSKEHVKMVIDHIPTIPCHNSDGEKFIHLHNINDTIVAVFDKFKIG